MASGLQEAAMTLSPLTDMTADDDDNDDDDRRGRRNRKDDSWSSRLFRSLSRATGTKAPSLVGDMLVAMLFTRTATKKFTLWLMTTATAT